MISVNINVNGLQEAINKITNMKTVVSDFSPETKAIGDYLLDFLMNEVFTSNGNVFGHPWAELSMPYAFYKYRRWGATGILIASGKMRNSYKLTNSADNMHIENESDYAGYHQSGTSKMPQRVMADIDQERSRQIIAITLKSLAERILNA